MERMPARQRKRLFIALHGIFTDHALQVLYEKHAVKHTLKTIHVVNWFNPFIEK
jgi:hypothetical protein